MPSIDIRKNKELIVMIMALADAYLEKGLYAEAAKRYNQLLQFNVSNKQLFGNFSKVLIGLKLFDKFAMGIYQKAIQYDIANKEIYIVLADTFLKDKRDDEAAMYIYETALNYNSPNSNKLGLALCEIYYLQNNFPKCKELSEKILLTESSNKKVMNYYLRSIEKTAQFDDAANILKKLLDTSNNKKPLLQRLSKLYLLKCFNANSETVRFSFIDRQYVIDFLNTVTNFEKLQDISFYLELKRFLINKKYWGELAYILPQQSSGMEIDFDSSMFRAESPALGGRGGVFDICNEVINKISPIDELTENSLTPRSSLTYDDFQNDGAPIYNMANETERKSAPPKNTEIIMCFEFSNFDELKEKYNRTDLEKLLNKFYAYLLGLFESYQIRQIWGANNGFVLFTKDIYKSITISIDLLNRLSQKNFENDLEDSINISIGIHHTGDFETLSEEQALNGLAAAIKASTVNMHDLAENERQEIGRLVQKSNRIILSDSTFNFIKDSNRYKVQYLGQPKLKYLDESFGLHEVYWRNPSNELKFGQIRKLGRFELLAELSNKHSIKVYKAKDADLQRLVILKVIQSERFNSLPANNPQKMQFYQIAQAQGQMNHPNIVNIYELDEDQGLTYIAREYIEGTNLTKVFQPGTFTIDRFIKIIYQVFKGLQYSHRLSFFHLNLKPTNILVTKNDETKLADFLIPGFLIDDAKKSSTPNDTNTYNSPEQFQAQQLDGRSDIFSMGVIMYQIITQRHPFVVKNNNDIKNAILNKEPLPPSEANNKVPRVVDLMILKCLEKEPEKRFQSVEEVVNLLKKNFERTLFSNFNYQISKSRDSY